MTKDSNAHEHQSNESCLLKQALSDLDFLLRYLGANGKNFPAELLAVLVECKHYGAVERWSKNQETKFWVALNETTKIIYPVTISSLKTFSTGVEGCIIGSSANTGRWIVNRAIFRYGAVTTVIVILIIIFQTYHLVGLDVLTKSKDLFNLRNQVREEIKQKEVASIRISEATIAESSRNPEPKIDTLGSEVGKYSSDHNSFCSSEEAATALQAQFNSIVKTDEEYQVLKAKETILDQEFDANRTIMYQWNRVWRWGRPLTPQLSNYDKYRYYSKIYDLIQRLLSIEGSEEFSECGRCISIQVAPDFYNTESPEGKEECAAYCDINSVAQSLLVKPHSAGSRGDGNRFCKDISRIKSQLKKTISTKTLHESRDIYFRSQLNSIFVLNILSSYILPMLYGCLGSLSMVLRSLCKSISEETFTFAYALDYNIRIVLGTVAGIASGLLMGDGGLVGASFSSILVSFVIGYNVDVLFVLVDNLANKIAQKSPPKDQQNAPVR